MSRSRRRRFRASNMYFGGMLEMLVELVTTTGDRDVVDPDPFTSESAQILIGEIMGCNLALENLNKNINDVIQKNKNIIDVLGRV
ncbi:hypothetical protein AB205_0136230 [Aquarana catesbeiana]|uniref:Uncharacterized protein n=1 Tax=Aquarana catesbeiana TaxID=8400 RepID=A0A2G9Q262_AQUCT|nr:hypothetical protein AB205_0136230 [Aquarana catesbeiana]